MTNELQTIPISSLYESPENSRHVFDERKLKELAQSIKAQGIKVRLIVRQGEEGKFEIVAGARRYRAAQLAGQTEVPCEIREYTDAEARDARLIENLQRPDHSARRGRVLPAAPRRRHRGREAPERSGTRPTDRQEREVRPLPP